MYVTMFAVNKKERKKEKVCVLLPQQTNIDSVSPLLPCVWTVVDQLTLWVLL